MAGVYIKGMKMPENCWQCGLKDSDNFCTAVFAVDDTVATVIGMWEETKRPDWCPLVEVPDHMDLIDKSVLYDHISGGYDIDFQDDPILLKEMLAMIDYQEVIIPADKEVV